MGKPRTKKGLVKKMCYLINHDGSSIPFFARGCGSGWIKKEEDALLLLDDYTTSDIVDYPDNEYTKVCREVFEKYWEDGMYIARLKHLNNYNEENFDTYFILWD